MRLMGNSGATIHLGLRSVEKIGGRQDLMREAGLLQILGEDVCPKLIGILPDKSGYVMERCVPCTPLCGDDEYFWILDHVLDILQNMVWTWAADSTNDKWRTEIRSWTQEYAPWIPDWLKTEATTLDMVCRMHGDPTLSNVLFRKQRPMENDQLLIGDPIPSRPCVPSSHLVDYGKLIQSCMGWEHVLDDAWAEPSPKVLEWMLRQIPRRILLPSLFWGAYHCARIGVTATDEKRRTWGKAASERLVQEAVQCSMPTT